MRYQQYVEECTRAPIGDKIGSLNLIKSIVNISRVDATKPNTVICAEYNLVAHVFLFRMCASISVLLSSQRQNLIYAMLLDICSQLSLCLINMFK